jgi:quercetin 2,3-dioxygenase
MQRRKFLAATAAAFPAIAIGKEIPAQRTGKGFVVKAKKSRFEETTKLYGNSDLTIFEYTGNVKGGPPLHIHLHQDEIFFIVEGNYTFKVGEDIHQLTAGDTIFLPRQVPHTFAQTSGTGKMFFLFTPSGKMEEYFRVLGKLTAPPTPEQGAKIFAEHDMKVVGPPLEV